jgi:hypothetical protein
MRGFSEFKENSAVHMRDASSGQRTVKVSAEVATEMGPGRTAEMSAGTMAATLKIGMKKMRDRILISDRRLHPTSAESSPHARAD